MEHCRDDHSRLLVPPMLHENVEEITILIHRPPKVVPLPVIGQKRLIQVLHVSRSGAPTP
jgi:hypothetical protein